MAGLTSRAWPDFPFFSKLCTHLIVFIASDLGVEQEMLQQIGNSSITSSGFYTEHRRS